MLEGVLWSLALGLRCGWCFEILKDLSPKTKGSPANKFLSSVRPHHKKPA